MRKKRCYDCEHFGLSKDPIFRVITGVCGRCGKEVGYTDKCLFEEERNDDIKFKLITYVDTDFEAKTQKCEYFIELEDGVERPLKDILTENVNLKEQVKHLSDRIQDLSFELRTALAYNRAVIDDEGEYVEVKDAEEFIDALLDEDENFYGKM